MKFDSDPEAAEDNSSVHSTVAIASKIDSDTEHVPFEDDPRSLSSACKWFQVAIFSYGALTPTTGSNMFFSALDDLQRDLNASSTVIPLSVTLYISRHCSDAMVSHV